MPTVATRQNGSQPSKQAAPSVPFLAGTYEYSEPITTLVVTPGASQQDFVVEITPGGFLRGVSLTVTTSTAGTGTPTAALDFPWNALANLSIESIDGTPLLYPMNGYSAYLVSRFTRSWDGDPATDPGYSAAVLSPAFNLRYFIESRMTIGCLPNTDARAQYRLRVSVAPSTVLYTVAATTNPTLSIQVNLESYAQPQSSDYAGNAIAQLPDGLVLQRFASHEIFNTNGGNQILKSNRVGNLGRCWMLVCRSSAGVRVALTADPIRWRLDNTQLLNEYRSRRTYENNREFVFGENYGSSAIPLGVYVYPRWHNPGDMEGPYWMPTTEASYLSWEMNGTPSGGTVEIITEDLAPAAAVPMYLQGL